MQQEEHASADGLRRHGTARHSRDDISPVPAMLLIKYAQPALLYHLSAGPKMSGLIFSHRIIDYYAAVGQLATLGAGLREAYLSLPRSLVENIICKYFYRSCRLPAIFDILSLSCTDRQLIYFAIDKIVLTRSLFTRFWRHTK